MSVAFEDHGEIVFLRGKTTNVNSNQQNANLAHWNYLNCLNNSRFLDLLIVQANHQNWWNSIGSETLQIAEFLINSTQFLMKLLFVQKDNFVLF